MIDLRGRHVLITGASSGLGRACAITASRAGATITALGRDSGRLQETIGQLVPGPHRAQAIDITQYAALDGVVADAVQANGPIAGFIHSAGIQKSIPLKGMTPESLHEIFAINVTAGLELTRIITKKKHAVPEGMSIILMGSTMSSLGDASLSAYCATKAALLGAVKALAVELAPRRIRVNCLSPGITQTEMLREALSQLPAETQQAFVAKHPLGLGQPDDVANAAAFLLSDLSRWITGTNFLVDGGYSAQ